MNVLITFVTDRSFYCFDPGPTQISEDN